MLDLASLYDSVSSNFENPTKKNNGQRSVRAFIGPQTCTKELQTMAIKTCRQFRVKETRGSFVAARPIEKGEKWRKRGRARIRPFFSAPSVFARPPPSNKEFARKLSRIFLDDAQRREETSYALRTEQASSFVSSRARGSLIRIERLGKPLGRRVQLSSLPRQ